MSKVENFQAPALPNLLGKQVIVPDSAWAELVAYLNLQTEAINAIAQGLSNMSALHASEFGTLRLELSRVQTNVQTIAQALEDVYNET